MSYYKLVKDLVEKISTNSSSSTRFIVLIFSTRYFNSNLIDILVYISMYISYLGIPTSALHESFFNLSKPDYSVNALQIMLHVY